MAVKPKTTHRPTERHSVFFVVPQKRRYKEIQTSDVTFNVACELPLQNFPAALKIERTLSLQVSKDAVKEQLINWKSRT